MAKKKEHSDPANLIGQTVQYHSEAEPVMAGLIIGVQETTVDLVVFRANGKTRTVTGVSMTVTEKNHCVLVAALGEVTPMES